MMRPVRVAYVISAYKKAMEKAQEEIGKVLDADDIAQAVLYAVSQPDHVAINEILVRPTKQAR